MQKCVHAYMAQGPPTTTKGFVLSAALSYSLILQKTMCITVVVGGAKWYRMYEWWEIVVYYANSMSELVWEPSATILHNKLWLVPKLTRLSRYVNRRI